MRRGGKRSRRSYDQQYNYLEKIPVKQSVGKRGKGKWKNLKRWRFMHDMGGNKGGHDVENIVVQSSNGRKIKQKIINESLSEENIQRRNEVVLKALEDCKNLGLFGSSKEQEQHAQERLQKISIRGHKCLFYHVM